MASNLEALEDWAAPLLQKLEPTERSKLARSLAQQLRRNQQQRVQSQKNPDGSKYAARKPRKLRGKQGRVRRKVGMFQKIRKVAYLKAKGDANAISVGFTGRIARIARVHQHGLKDRPQPGAPDTSYAKREVLGLSSADHDLIRDALLAHLSL
ncbi:phage virion morphogenesis protein [Pseudomonas sp. JAI115]|uniref:phage virion morphogenesis protein n=1 Tax=Pseudomonas sp. JAI115 TaxID=2723061 RepID=UPI00160D1D32|nr:phage virion morphogenesis protein [Pseudomonas sp. JAI115]MBB6153704.1 phage virion morphogenesis protein [Pseudomonas sp. JAI115]